MFHQVAALFSLIDEDGDGLIVEEEVQRVLADAAQLVHEATPQVLAQATNILVERFAQRVYEQLQVPFVLALRKSLPSSAISSFVEGLVKKDSLDSKKLFRQYSVSAVSSTGAPELGITPAMFGKLLEQILDLDGVFRSMDSWLPIDSEDEVIRSELKSLRLQLQERFVGEQLGSLSSLIFRAIDLDNSGLISQSELDGFINLLHHTSSFAESNKANDLRQSLTAVAMTQINVTLETEVQHIMHVLQKKGRVTCTRLTAFIDAILSIYKSFLGEYIDVHTNKKTRHHELRRITSRWFSQISGGKGSMNIKAFAAELGPKVITFLH